jgi:AbrB family looped-hinge helix DNA binding protein
MNTIKLNQRGVLTLPKNIRDAFGLKTGEILVVSKEDNRIVLERQQSDKELLRDIQHSLRDIKQGKFIEFGSMNEFKKKMKTYGEN